MELRVSLVKLNCINRSNGKKYGIQVRDFLFLSQFDQSVINWLSELKKNHIGENLKGVRASRECCLISKTLKMSVDWTKYDVKL